jgi:RimJ/RimL family protein N-acetyltransferase
MSAALSAPERLSALIGATAAHDWRPCHSAIPRRGVITHALVILKEKRVVIGDVRFECAGRAPCLTYEIGYSIARAHRRQGYATEATRAVIHWLRDEVGVDQIIAGCDMRNTASIRSLRKLGFMLDGSSPKRNAFWWTLDFSAPPRRI